MPVTVTDHPKLLGTPTSRKLSGMTSKPRAATKITDPTGKHVASNVRRIREARSWSTYELASRLEQAGRPIAASAVAKVERAERRVDVGDLAALATVLGVSPAALLLPFTERGTDPVEVTGGGTTDASDAWKWAQGQRPFRLTPGRERTEFLEFQLYGLPQWLGPVGRDAATANAWLRESGFPMDEWLRKQGLVESEGGTDGPSVD